MTSNYRALLQKMTYTDKASYGSSPPCNLTIDARQSKNDVGYGLFYRALLQKRPIMFTECIGYGVAMISRLLQILGLFNMVSFIGLFCKRDL